jgi:hypothetical protein
VFVANDFMEAAYGPSCEPSRYKLLTKIPISLGLADGRFTTIWHGKDLSSGKDVVLKVGLCACCMDATRFDAF